MQERSKAGLLLGALLWATPAGAQQAADRSLEISYSQALALARSQAPALVAERARAREAEGQVARASVWRFNPQVAGAAGQRRGDSGTDLDWFVSAQQWLEVGGQRRDRVDAARAASSSAEARSTDAQRRLLQEVGVAFATALYWAERSALAEENARIAGELLRSLQRRHALGDAGGLALSTAALAQVRAQAEGDLARVASAEARGTLAALLGVEAGVRLVPVGDLRTLGGELPVSAQDVEERPDLVALRAERKQAAAQGDLARSKRIPDLALAARYGREEGDRLLRGTLTLAVPLFDRGQGERAAADLRAARVDAELTATRRSALTEAESARERWRVAHLAAERYAQSGLTVLERAEQQATTSYEAGAVPLAELLTIRRELLRARVDHADLLLAAATARVDLAASTGALR